MKTLPKVGESVWYLSKNGPRQIRVTWAGGRVLEGKSDSRHTAGCLLSEVFRTRKECIMARVRDSLQAIKYLERDIEKERAIIDRLLGMMEQELGK